MKAKWGDLAVRWAVWRIEAQRTARAYACRWFGHRWHRLASTEHRCCRCRTLAHGAFCRPAQNMEGYDVPDYGHLCRCDLP